MTFLSSINTGTLTAAQITQYTDSNNVDDLLKGSHVTPLIAAVLAGEISSVELLLNVGSADPDKATEDGMTPLAWVAERGKQNRAQIAWLLLKRNASVDKACNMGTTPLMRAVWSRNLELVRVLVDAGADTSKKNKIGETAANRAKLCGDEIDEVVSPKAGKSHLDLAGLVDVIVGLLRLILAWVNIKSLSKIAREIGEGMSGIDDLGDISKSTDGASSNGRVSPQRGGLGESAGHGPHEPQWEGAEGTLANKGGARPMDANQNPQEKYINGDGVETAEDTWPEPVDGGRGKAPESSWSGPVDGEGGDPLEKPWSGEMNGDDVVGTETSWSGEIDGDDIIGPEKSRLGHTNGDGINSAESFPRPGVASSGVNGVGRGHKHGVGNVPQKPPRINGDHEANNTGETRINGSQQARSPARNAPPANGEREGGIAPKNPAINGQGKAGNAAPELSLPNGHGGTSHRAISGDDSESDGSEGDGSEGDGSDSGADSRRGETDSGVRNRPATTSEKSTGRADAGLQRQKPQDPELLRSQDENGVRPLPNQQTSTAEQTAKATENNRKVAARGEPRDNDTVGNAGGQYGTGWNPEAGRKRDENGGWDHTRGLKPAGPQAGNTAGSHGSKELETGASIKKGPSQGSPTQPSQGASTQPSKGSSARGGSKPLKTEPRPTEKSGKTQRAPSPKVAEAFAAQTKDTEKEEMGIIKKKFGITGDQDINAGKV